MNEYYKTDVVPPRPRLVGKGFSLPLYRVLGPGANIYEISFDEEFIKDYAYLLNRARKSRLEEKSPAEFVDDILKGAL